MEILGVITARGGSKRVPKKNVREIAGKPLIEYTIDAACESTRLTRVTCTTDDAEVDEICIRRGIEVVKREEHLASDLTPDLLVFQDLLRRLLILENYRPDVVVHLRPTAPFITGALIDRAVSSLLGFPEADSSRSICKPKRGPLKLWEFKGYYFIKPYSRHSRWSEAHSEPVQTHANEVYMQNGVVDVIRYDTIVKKNSMTGSTVVGMIMHDEESWCIDTEFDWKVAELLLCDRLKE